MRRVRATPATHGASDDLPLRADASTVERLQLGRIIEGSLAVDRRNRLQYRVGSAGREQVFNLDGTWRLTPDHALALTLHGAGREDRRSLYLNGAVVRATHDTLVFALRRRESDETRASQRLTLSGRWQADARNRLTFLLEQAEGEEDRLTLQGGWEVGPHHELAYRYERRLTPRGALQVQSLLFEGAWDIAGTDRLVFRMRGSSDATFEFTARLQTPSLIARDGRLVYEVGIGMAGGATRRQQVTLFGAWKVNRDLSVSFEVPYAGGRVEAIRLTGTFALGARNQVVAALSSRQGEALGLTVVFTRELFPDARLFLRVQHDAEERSVIGGVQVRF